jgi:hypothetical protein
VWRAYVIPDGACEGSKTARHWKRRTKVPGTLQVHSVITHQKLMEPLPGPQKAFLTWSHISVKVTKLCDHSQL